MHFGYKCYCERGLGSSSNQLNYSIRSNPEQQTKGRNNNMVYYSFLCMSWESCEIIFDFFISISSIHCSLSLKMSRHPQSHRFAFSHLLISRGPFSPATKQVQDLLPRPKHAAGGQCSKRSSGEERSVSRKISGS